MPLPDNAPEKWELYEHTKVKHQILEKYIKAWFSILGSFNSRLGYFDCFAGRGIYTDGEPGSPIIVMKAAQEQMNKINNKVKKFLCAFIENNPDNYDSLKKQINHFKSECPDCECFTEFGDFDDVINNFLDETEDKKLIPALFFIDPFGWSGIPFSTIQRILTHRFSEIIFVLMTYEMARFLKSKPHENSLTTLFGGNEWKQALRFTGEARHKAIVQLYWEKIKTDTKAQFVWSFRVNDSEMKKRTKYYIIHACHNIKGLRVMKNLMRKAGSGVFEYLGPEDDVLKYQARFDFYDLESYLLDHFKGRVISFDGTCDELYPITDHPVSTYVDSDFRNALKNLEKVGKIQVYRKTSKTDKGLGGKDLIDFS